MKRNNTSAAQSSTFQDTFNKGAFDHLFTRDPFHYIDKEDSARKKMEVNTHIANHIDRIEIDGFAKSLLEETFPNWMPKALQNELKGSLRGFSDWAAIWVAESLMDCYCGQALATTGIKHIDDMLWMLYSKILKCAREKGVKIANHF